MNDYEDFIEIARVRAKEVPPGIYKLGEIFGDMWDAIPDHNGLGVCFKAEVLAGKVDGVEWLERGSDNNQRYRVFKADC